MGVSESQVYKLIKAVSFYSEEELKALRHAKTRVNVADLKKLSRITDPEDRRRVIDQIKSGEAASVSEAVARLKTPFRKASPDDLALQALMRLLNDLDGALS